MRRSRSITRTAIAVVPAGIVVAGVAVTVAATRHVPNAASSPLEPAGRWHTALVVALPLAFAAYAVASLLALRLDVSRRLAAAVACLVQVIPLGGPLLLSTDAYTYWAYGRVADPHRANPYATVPAAFPGDPAYRAMGATWHHTTTIYGPLFTWLSRLVASAASSAHVAELAFRVGAAAAMVAIVLVLYVARAPAAAIIVAGWSPLFALHFAGGGHNDSLMMLFAVAALALGRRRSKLAAVLWIAAIAVKWVAVALLAVDLFARRRRERLRFARDLVAAGVIGVILASIEYGSAWFDAIGGLSSQSHRTSTLGPAGWLHDAGLGHREILAALGLALVILGAALAAAAFVRGRRHPSILGTGTAALQGWLNPWYPAWGGATVAFDDAPVAATVLTLALSAVVLRDALPL